MRTSLYVSLSVATLLSRIVGGPDYSSCAVRGEDAGIAHLSTSVTRVRILDRCHIWAEITVGCGPLHRWFPSRVPPPKFKFNLETLWIEELICGLLVHSSPFYLLLIIYL